MTQLVQINLALAEKQRQKRSTIRHDIDFHTVLFQATHNQVLIDLIPLLVEYFRFAVVHRPGSILHSPRCIVDEHQRIIEALAARSMVAARQALLEHLDPPGSSPWRQPADNSPAGNGNPL